VPENESEVKWKALGDRALTVWRFDLAREAYERAGDLSALMLLLLAVGDREGLRALAAKAGALKNPIQKRFFFFPSCYSYFVLYFLFIFVIVEKGQNNLAFAITLQLGDASGCVDLLVKTQRAPEAALFARTYAPRLVNSRPYFFHDFTDDIFFPSSNDVDIAKPQKLCKPGNLTWWRKTAPRSRRWLLIPRLTLNCSGRDGRTSWQGKRHSLVRSEFFLSFYGEPKK
jgi:hypothetical protein